MIYLLDTNVASELLKSHPRIVARLETLDDGDVAEVPIVAWLEIVRGRTASLLAAADEKELLIAQSRLDHDLEAMSNIPVVGLKVEAARHFGSLLSHKKCRRLRRPDMLIACIALANRAVLVTRNVKDFANVPGLTLQNWFE